MSVELNKEYIQSIIANDNLVVRNLQVTQGYYTLSQGMRRYMSNINANWCTFATHASKTAGQALRHELLPHFLKSTMIRLAGYDNTLIFFDKGLGNQEQHQLGKNDSRLGEGLRQVSLLISAGNIKVFEELVWPFSALLNSFKKNWAYDQGILQAFLDEHLRPGPINEDGQDYLIEAFTVYYKARFETSPKKKSEYVLLANLLVGLHEQNRLQPQIEQSLSVPFDIFSESYKDSGASKMGLINQTGRTRKIVSRVITHMLMSITLPSRELKLSKNVVAPTGIFSYPKDLLRITDPRCLELVRSFERGQDTLSGSGAENWASLPDRMSFIVDLFRSHQQYIRLWDPPFLPQQVTLIESGSLPPGPL